MSASPVVWFLTGSQGLYGPETVAQVEQVRAVAQSLVDHRDQPVHHVLHPCGTHPRLLIHYSTELWRIAGG